MLSYLLIGALLALLVAQRWDHGRQAKQNALTHSEQLKATLEHVRELTNQIVLLKVEPKQAASLAFPPPDPEGVHISPFDDEALAQHEDERRGLRLAD